jgi:hypothetical protein
MGVLLAPGCQRPYRVGERVKVLFDKKECPGFITEIRARSRFQVHFTFEGYVWDEAVSLDRVKGVAEDTLPNCQPPERVARALGIRGKKEKEAVTPYKVGDRIRVRWRESAYPATVLEAIAADKLRIHYDGYDEAWDEVIATDRILSREQ